MEPKNDIESLNNKFSVIPTNKIDFKKLNRDIELGKHTIKIISCGLCDYNCQKCYFGKFY